MHLFFNGSNHGWKESHPKENLLKELLYGNENKKV